MKNRILVFLFILLWFSLKSIAVCSEENTIAVKGEKGTSQELNRLVSNDQSLTAIWIGNDPRILTESPDTPLALGVKALIFQFSDDNQIIKFNPVVIFIIIGVLIYLMGMAATLYCYKATMVPTM